MKLKSYPKYKDSGVQWIGEIPEDWDIHKIKYLLKIPITDGPHETPEFIDKGIPFLSIDSIQNGEIIFENTRFISEEDYIKYKVKCNPKRNDIFMGKAASIGKIARVKVDFPFSIWSPLALLRANKKIKPPFFEYVLKSNYSQDQIDNFSTSNTQKNISMDNIPRIQLILPNDILEQKKLITFLDRKNQNISKTIEKDKKLIELLKEKRIALINHVVTKGLDKNAKMKDSGIGWIGEIPEDWAVKKLKYLTIEIKNKIKNICNVDYVGLEHIEQQTGKILSYGTSNDVDGELLKFQKGDILFSKLRPYLVKVVLTNQKGVCSTEIIIYKSKKDITPEYLKYRLISRSYIYFVNAITYGVKMPRADPTTLSNIKFAVPPKSQQLQITKYLDYHTKKINQTIKKIQEKITLMEEYKKSLINHVVTGKVDVRGVVV